MNTNKHFTLFVLLIVSAVTLTNYKNTEAQASVSNWWPVQGTRVSGEIPFKGILNHHNVDDYVMYWSVDNGNLNVMPTNLNEYPHKEALVNTGDWKWKGAGPYNINFVAINKGNGIEIARVNFDIYNNDVSNTKSSTMSPVVEHPSVNAYPSTGPSVIGAVQPNVFKPFAGMPLYVHENSDAKNQASIWRNYRPEDAAQIDKIANNPQALWLGEWSGDVRANVSGYVSAASVQGKLPVMVTYNIPQRDCGSYSAGGLPATSYLNWVNEIVAGIGNRRAVVIVEPDAIAAVDCLSRNDQTVRLKLIADAVRALKSGQQTYVYIDAGHARWLDQSTAISRLTAAGIDKADGFSLNVSNFISTPETVAYGEKLGRNVGGKHFIVDTSRNGKGSEVNDRWCNPWGMSLGDQPTTNVANSLVDAYLWIKVPGQSDGSCNGGPPAGQWWGDYALDLARNAAF